MNLRSHIPLLKIKITTYYLLIVTQCCFTIVFASNAQEANTPEKNVIKLIIESSPGLNPSPEGRPSPVVLHIFQLRDTQIFETADFFSLIDSHETLGQALISKQELTLLPAKTLNLDLKMSQAANFVALIAEYRDLEKAHWRGSIQITSLKNNRLQVLAGTLSISITKPSKK